MGMKPGSRQVRRVVAAAVVAAAAVVGAACSEVQVAVDVRDSDQVTMSVEFLSDPAAARELEARLGGDPTKASGLPQGMSIDKIDRDGRTGYRMNVEYESVDMVAAMLAAPPDGQLQSGLPLLSSLSISEGPAEGEWRFEGTAKSTDQFMAELGQALSGRGLDPAMLPTADQLWTGGDDGLYLTVKLPGVVAETNAAASGRNSATWPLHEMQTGDPLLLVSEPEGFPTRMQLYVGGGIAALILLIGLSSAVRRARRRGAARERAAARAQYQTGLMTPSAWQEPATPGWAPPAGAAPPSPSQVTFDPGTGRPLVGTGVADQPLSQTIAPSEGAAPIAPTRAAGPPPGHVGAGQGWAPPDPTQLIAPAAPTEPAEPVPPAAGSADPAPAAIEAIAEESAVAPSAEDPAPAPAAGWYADPLGQGTNRWWTGTEWSEHFE